MTSGSWTFGDPVYYRSAIYASKSWVGSDGKYEEWLGGTRVKFNDYTVTRHRFICSKKPVNDTGYGTVSIQNPVTLKNIVGWTANDDLRLLEKLAEAIRGHTFDLGINIAEASKSYGTILGNLRSLGRSLRAVKRGDFPEAVRSLGRTPSKSRLKRFVNLKDVSGRWLELQYAWRPLVDQSYQAAKALEAMTGPRSLRFKATSATKRATYEGSQAPSVWKYPVNVSYSKKILADLYEEVSFARALGLTNPAAIAWEVVPYSFVVDWFIPVGTYLGAVGIIPSLKGRFLTTTRIGQKAGTVTILPPNNGGYVNLGKVETWFNLTRTPSSSLTVPKPRFNRLPRALSPKRLLNAVALIHQRLK